MFHTRREFGRVEVVKAEGRKEQRVLDAVVVKDWLRESRDY